MRALSPQIHSTTEEDPMPRRPRLVWGWLASVSFVHAACAAPNSEKLEHPPPETVKHVSLVRYGGKWHEIASFPQTLQKECAGTTVTYTLRSDGGLDIVTRCRKGSLQGREEIVRGRARIVDPRSNAKLQVSFFWPSWGDYWILDLAPDYSYAVVGHPSRNRLWILSRTPRMDEKTYAAILDRLKAMQYDVGRLKKTEQPTP
jgi:apolipoprotein D and lipocalin family protein